ncbi:MAG: hypothetical protein ACLQVI_25710 [Polyangiaceae bacterium]
MESKIRQKFDFKKATALRAEFAAGLSINALAMREGCTRQTMQFLIRGRRYRESGEPWMVVLMMPADLHARVAQAAALKDASIESMILEVCAQKFKA